MEVTVRMFLFLLLKCLLGTRDIFLDLKTNRGGCGQKMLNFPHCALSISISLKLSKNMKILFPNLNYLRVHFGMTAMHLISATFFILFRYFYRYLLEFSSLIISFSSCWKFMSRDYFYLKCNTKSPKKSFTKSCNINFNIFLVPWDALR